MCMSFSQMQACLLGCACAHLRTQKLKLAQRQQRNELFICCRCSATLHQLRARRYRRPLPWTMSDDGLIQWRMRGMPAKVHRDVDDHCLRCDAGKSEAVVRGLVAARAAPGRSGLGGSERILSPRRTRRRRRASAARGVRARRRARTTMGICDLKRRR